MYSRVYYFVRLDIQGTEVFKLVRVQYRGG